MNPYGYQILQCTIMASGRELHRGSYLLSLPAELRNDMYELVVVKDEPIIAYVINKPVRRSTATQNAGRLSYKTTTSPRLPAVVHACRQTYIEACPVFFGKNTFIFSQKCSGGSLLRWENYMACSTNEVYTIQNLMHIIIEFEVRDPDPRVRAADAEIEANLCADGRVDVQLRGALATRCDCQLRDNLSRYNAEEPSASPMPQNRLLHYLEQSKHHRSQLKGRTGRWRFTECSKCGKLGLTEVHTEISSQG